MNVHSIRPVRPSDVLPSSPEAHDAQVRRELSEKEGK